MVEGAAQEVFAAEGNGEQFEEALHGSGGGDAAADVIDQDELSAGAQDAGHFVEGFGVVGDGAEPEGADDGVEGGVVER